MEQSKTTEINNNSILLITSKNKEKVFEIKNDGSVGYTVNGKYRLANTDKKLGVALGEAFKTLVMLNEETIRKQNIYTK